MGFIAQNSESLPLMPRPVGLIQGLRRPYARHDLDCAQV